jgi:hypothetical protein
MPANVKTTHVARRYFVCFPLPLLLFIYLPLLRSRSIVKEDPEADLSEAESSLYLPGSMDEELFADLPTVRFLFDSPQIALKFLSSLVKQLNLSSTFLQAILRRSNFCTLGSFR